MGLNILGPFWLFHCTPPPVVFAMTEYSEVAQDYGAILLGGLLAFGCVVSLDQKICTCLTELFTACRVVLTCNSSYTGDCTLASLGVLSHWYGSSSSGLHFLIALHRSLQHGAFDCLFARDKSCQWDSGCLTCAIPHLWQLPSGIPSLCLTVMWINLTGSLGTCDFIIYCEPET